MQRWGLGLGAVVAGLVTSGTALAAGPSFSEPLPKAVGGATGAPMVVTELNGDGIPDVALVAGFAQPQSSDHLVLLLGKGDGTFRRVQRAQVGSRAYFLRSADVNRDGRVDLIVGTYSPADTWHVQVWFGRGNGTASAGPIVGVTGVVQGLVTSSQKPPSLIVRSLDGQRLTEVVGNADGLFAAGNVIAAVPGPSPQVTFGSVASGDLNGDGHDDVVAAVDRSDTSGGTFTSSSPREVIVAHSTAAGTWKPGVAVNIPVTAPGALLRPVQLADVNGDGRLDLLGSYDGIWRANGNGDGTFGAPERISALRQPSGPLAVGDLNGDGRADIVVPDQPMHVLFARPSGWAQVTVKSVTGFAIGLADINRDGRTDIVQTNSMWLFSQLNSARRPAIGIARIPSPKAGRIFSAGIVLSARSRVTLVIRRQGRPVVRRSLSVARGWQQVKVPVNRALRPGSYTIEFQATNGGGTSTVTSAPLVITS